MCFVQSLVVCVFNCGVTQSNKTNTNKSQSIVRARQVDKLSLLHTPSYFAPVSCRSISHTHWTKKPREGKGKSSPLRKSLSLFFFLSQSLYVLWSTDNKEKCPFDTSFYPSFHLFSLGGCLLFLLPVLFLFLFLHLLLRLHFGSFFHFHL